MEFEGEDYGIQYGDNVVDTFTYKVSAVPKQEKM